MICIPWCVSVGSSVNSMFVRKKCNSKFFYFFFSSRRRHTRSLCDWSSDVCSSDLSGGSAFGLDAASGVMRYLEERGVGFATVAGPVPIVPAASLFDLGIGRADVRPDAAAGYAACHAAGEEFGEGCVGAGTGCTVAKLGGPDGAIKAGIGSAVLTLLDGTLVA